jgi:hypothetical protein
VRGLIILVGVLLTAAVACAAEEINLGDVFGECSSMKEEERGYVQVNWIPTKVYEYCLSRRESAHDAVAASLFGSLRSYVMVTVSAVRVGKDGKAKFASRETINKRTVRLRDGSGATYEPLPPGAGGPAVELFVTYWEEFVSPQFGEVSEAMVFYVFPGKDPEGRLIADPEADGSFTVFVGEHEFVWELPLASLLEPKYCPECGRELSGVYNYCPFDGAVLGPREFVVPELAD